MLNLAESLNRERAKYFRPINGQWFIPHVRLHDMSVCLSDIS